MAHAVEVVAVPVAARIPVPSPTIVSVVRDSAPHLPMGCSPWSELAFCLVHLASSSVIHLSQDLHPRTQALPCRSSRIFCCVSQDFLGNREAFKLSLCVDELRLRQTQRQCELMRAKVR